MMAEQKTTQLLAVSGAVEEKDGSQDLRDKILNKAQSQRSCFSPWTSHQFPHCVGQKDRNEGESRQQEVQHKAELSVDSWG